MRGEMTKDDTSKREQRFKAWGKNLCTRQALDQGLVLNILQVFFKNRGRNLVFKKGCISWGFWLYFMLQDIPSKKNFTRLMETFRPITYSCCLFANTLTFYYIPDWKKKCLYLCKAWVQALGSFCQAKAWCLQGSVSYLLLLLSRKARNSLFL